MPLLLYNVTMYTGVNLAPDAVEKLSEHPNIVGLKDSGNDMLQIGDYLSRSKPGFTVFAGRGADALHRRGARRSRRGPRAGGHRAGALRRAVRAGPRRPRRARPARCTGG